MNKLINPMVAVLAVVLLSSCVQKKPAQQASPAATVPSAQQAVATPANTNNMPKCDYNYNLTSCKISCSPVPCIDTSKKCGGAISGCTNQSQVSSGLVTNS